MKSEPAFPVKHRENLEERLIGYQGFTKREYFAGLAMQGLLVSQDPGAAFCDGSWTRVVAQKAVEYADALLAELEKEPQ